MNYFVTRGEQQYGPYSLADLQRYVQQGNIAPIDLARSEGMTDWVPVSQIIGNIMVAPLPPQNAFGVPMQPEQLPLSALYPPPSLNWGILLLLGIVTCGIFGIVWAFVQAAWIKKVRPAATTIIPLLIAYVVVAFGGVFASLALKMTGFELLGRWGGLILFQLANFRMRDAIEDYFNVEEKMNLSLSGVMTFFFSVYYFQYHFTQLRKLKQEVGSLNTSY